MRPSAIVTQKVPRHHFRLEALSRISSEQVSFEPIFIRWGQARPPPARAGYCFSANVKITDRNVKERDEFRVLDYPCAGRVMNVHTWADPHRFSACRANFSS
jgi:hypothetical protein